ncbi:phospho-sugar mutase [Pseudonocardia sp. KRD-184]|uniref:Phospho-sugar mutase n=1 Tax=Pseudonocardia oceani TaxID=2792013 RepID=A0ABS6U6I8_9PSEU|nr:phospho-sugar mutase [Pseudonocardia oceani]MBW0098604.1 phospho-sugar mutase [Pseudonocardia oceani]MBW0111120.1 phospho-sugar mutase [Pseudonocardia oceani]MBW0120706.1 phospho-sugar mutase [Pseudonocardia oceani]MBW0127848.1 phospho-sugar mutase [Pseudonocardia oceani]
MTPELRDATLRWIADDPDPATRAELQRVLADVMAGGPDDDLADRMSGMLRFGTAGLRGPVRAGPAGMNVAVVRRATAGLAAWLARDGVRGTVVVGRDARHGSEAFAAAAAEVLAGAGFTARTLPGPLPTPVLAFAVRELGAVAGVQVTASHNPPADNGYKVYLADGAQLAPPSDAGIEAAITAAPAAVSVPTSGDASGVDVTESYLDRVARLPRGTARTLRVALTPMHGVGGATAVHALGRAGFTDVHVVASQAAPDPDFPTVVFPNPEEPGATDALLALAAEVGADLAIALDPDADRCALGVPTCEGWRMLTGDETGVLLGDHLLRTGTGDDPLVATTVVSSSMLRSVAQAHGARFAETLTGFKWIVRGGPGLVYGYEEALGYCVDPGAVNDKDGIAAATVACDLAATLKAEGKGLPDRLDALSAEHGVHLTRGISVRMEPGPRDAAVARLRDAPPQGWAVTRPAPDVLVLRREGERLVIRPSGTEPKLKAYLEVVEHGDRARAQERLDALAATVTDLLGA